jgi:ribosomal protein L29
LGQTHLLQQAQRDIARVKTVMGEVLEKSEKAGN